MIKIDYDKAQRAAQKISSAAEECRQLRSSANRLISAVSAGWQGRSGEAFSSKGSTWMREIQSIQNELSDISRDILHTVDEFKAAEDRVKKEIAASVGGGGRGF